MPKKDKPILKTYKVNHEHCFWQLPEKTMTYLYAR